MTQIQRDIPSGLLQPQEVLEVTQGPPVSKDRTIYMVAGCPSQARFLVHNHCLENLKRGLVERVFCVERNGTLCRTPQPVNGAFDGSLFRKFRAAVVERVGFSHRMGYDGFLSYYSGAKLRNYQRAVESLRLRRLEEKDSYLTTFVKAEKISTTKGDPAPRIIQPRDPRYNVELGCYLRHKEKSIMHAIDDVFGETTCIKGYTSEEVGAIFKDKWDQYHKPVAIGLDASRFDQHCSVEALEYEHSFYQAMYPGDKKLAKLLKWQLTNRGVGYTPNGKVRYVKRGCRMSGDMNTSLGNYTLMCAMVYAFIWSKLRGQASLANCGDDCVLICESGLRDTILEELPEFFLKLGYTMKVEKPVYELEHIEFCQAHPVQFAGGWKMVRNIHTAMGKDVHCVNNLRTDMTRKAWTTAQHKGGMALMAGIPVFEAYYKQFPVYEDLGKHEPLDNITNEHKWRGSGKFYPITPESRCSLWSAFGLTGDDQYVLEEIRLPSWNINLLGSEGEDGCEPSILHYAAA